MMILQGDKLEIQEPGSWNFANVIVKEIHEDGTFTVQLEAARYQMRIGYEAIMRNLSDPE